MWYRSASLTKSSKTTAFYPPLGVASYIQRPVVNGYYGRNPTTKASNFRLLSDASSSSRRRYKRLARPRSSRRRAPCRRLKSEESAKAFSVIDEFDNWRKQPELAEAVAAIGALASVIQSSEANTMMELEIELKKASDSLQSWDGLHL